MNYSKVGAVSTSHRQNAFVEWKIPNYFSFPQRADTCIQSPPFFFANTSWCIILYPNGQRHNDTVEWISLYLKRINSKVDCVDLYYSLALESFYDDLKSSTNELYYSYDFTNVNSISGSPNFMERSELCRNRYRLLFGGVLTVICDATYYKSVASVASQTICVNGANALSRDFHSLLQNKQKSDVIIKVKNQTFNVHKLILGARSPVFAAMFEHNMKENSTGVVNIADCDPEIFQDFLSFMYTGNVETLSSKNVFQLFMLSDKYDTSVLREMCADFMKDNLCLDVACEVAAVADKHNLDDLRASAIELITNNIKCLIPTEQWISFMRDNPVLAAELLMTVIPDVIS